MNFDLNMSHNASPVFDPKLLQAHTYEDYAKLTNEQKAGKLIVHTMDIQGHGFHVWSKYDDKAVLIQRCMIRSDLWEAQCRQ